MNRAGHVGFTLTVIGLILYSINIVSRDSIILLLLSGAFSALPDIDLRLEIRHRRYTHNVIVATIVSIPVGLLTYYAGLGFWVGFLACLSGFLCHIFSDLLTYMSFPPLWPINKKEVSLKLFNSNNKVVNGLFTVLGALITLTFILRFYAI
ncbi:MAG: metal-dependent hydrolase [Candidatus Nezhaarchaeales archaeon]